MRKRSLFIVLVLIGLSMSAQENLMKNGGFEYKNPLSGWGRRKLAAEGQKDPVIDIDKTNKKSGENALKITTFGKKDLVILVAGPVAVKTGKTYKVSCWIKNSGCKFSLRQDLVNAKGRHIRERYKSNINTAASFDWKYFETKVAIKKGEEKLGFTMFIGKVPGTIWLDDFAIEEILPKAGNEVTFRLTPNYYTDDNIYYLPQNDPMIMFLTAANELQYESGNPRIVIELPVGVELVGCDMDAEEYAKPVAVKLAGKPYTRYEYKMGLPDMLMRNIDYSRTAFGSAPIMVKAIALPSDSMLTGYVHFRDDKISCRKCPFKMKIMPSIPSAQTPKLFQTGISSGTSLEFFGGPLQEWITFYKNCGFNEIIVPDFLRVGSRNYAKYRRNPQPIIKELNDSGLTVYCNSNRLINGYMVRYIPMSKEYPEDILLKRADGTVAKSVFDPAYIYRKGEWYVKAVNYVVDQALERGYDHLWCNWEPHYYRLENGSFTKRSLQDFAEHSGIPYAELSAMDTRKIPEKYKEKLMAFQSWQFGKAMQVLNQIVKEKSQEKGKDIKLLLCVGPNFLSDFVKGKKYWDYTGCFLADDFLKHIDQISSWHYLYYQSKDMLDKTQKQLVDLGFRKGELDVLKNRTHRETLDQVEKKVTFIDKICKQDKRPAIPYIHLSQNMQCNDWVVKPTAIGLQMLAAFIGGAKGVQLYYFPMGYDGRYWQSAAEANNNIAHFEDTVMNGRKLKEGFQILPLTDLFKSADYKQNLAWRAFEKNGKIVLALCNFDFIDDALIELKCSNTEYQKFVFENPINKEYFSFKSDSVFLRIPAMTVQFFESGSSLTEKAGWKNIQQHNIKNEISVLNQKYKQRLAKVKELTSQKNVIQTVDYSNIKPLNENGCSANFDGQKYVINTANQQVTILPKAGAVIKSWLINGKEHILPHFKAACIGKDRFYVPKGYMNHPELSEAYKFVSHNIKDGQFGVTFQKEIENGELAGVIIEKTISVNGAGQGINIAYEFKNSIQEPKLIGFWNFNSLAAFQEKNGKNPVVKFGDTATDVIGKICLFQNRKIPLLKGYEKHLQKICHPDVWQKKTADQIDVSGLKIKAVDASLFLTWKISKLTATTSEVIFPPKHLQPGCSWKTDIEFGLSGQSENQYPKSVTVNSGDLQVRFDSKKFWNINRIEYKGKRLGIDKPASHYGTVFNFPGTGFIGTGHTENESEVVTHLSFCENGNMLNKLPESAIIKANSFSVKRESRIRNFSLKTETTIENNIIDQRVSINAEKDSHLALLYNFMHPWTVNMTHYLAMPATQIEEEGAFATCGKRLVNKEMEWVAFYNANNQTGVCMLLAEKADKGGALMQLWDVAPYRKFYLSCFNKQVFPKNYTANYRMLLSFFEAPESSWKNEARKIMNK